MNESRYLVLTIARGRSRLDEIASKLSVAGATVLCDRVETVDDAVTALGVGSYDCVLFDVQGDVAAAERLKERLIANSLLTPIVVVSEMLTSQDMMRLLRANVADCLAGDDIRAERVLRAVWSATRAARTERALSLAESQRAFNALHDQLTGLPNRSLFFDRLHQALALGERQRTPVAVITCNLNGFNRINGEMGHQVGDRLLQQVAERLQKVLRRSDTLARLGDDEYAMILPTGANEEGARRTAEKLIESLDMPFDILDHSFAIGIRVGIAIFPTHGTSASQLLVRAEVAMRDGRRSDQRFAVHVASRIHDAEHGRPLIDDLRHALTEGDRQLYVTFQPKIDLKSQHIDGVEALVRWRHPQRGMVFPDQFIPLAEESGLIDRLTTHVLNHSLAQQTAWRAENIDLTVAVNLSAKTLQDPRFPDQVQDLLTKWQADPSRLILEITESAIILDVERATATLERLDQLGIGISIDDFGTGYTCLSYIRRLPVQEIKVDRSFVMGMTRSPDDWVIVSSLVDLGHNLGMTVVAEGVEDERTLTMLADMGCDFAQGYHMSRPVPADELAQWLLESRWGLEQRPTVDAPAQPRPAVRQLHIVAGS
ncbi:MAG: bifunctional diguanylate cyclase/phosphodiesterase [Pseudomonadota bacterium]|nr:bifunctional diguanylate cyclase/phosphodiesterase [Pseudomonadota bacterium]